MAETLKTTQELILDLQEAGITNEYCNLILNMVKTNEREAYEAGKMVGHEEARAIMFKKFSTAENFNTQHLREWVTKLDFDKK